MSGELSEPTHIHDLGVFIRRTQGGVEHDLKGHTTNGMPMIKHFNINPYIAFNDAQSTAENMEFTIIDDEPLLDTSVVEYQIYYNNLIVLKEVTSKTEQDLHKIIGIFNSLLGTIDNSIQGRCDFGRKVVERKTRSWYGKRKIIKICAPYNLNNKTRIDVNINKLYKYAYQYIESEKAYKKI